MGADLLNADSGSIAEMIAAPKQAVLLLNVEPEADVAGGAAAVDALKQAKSVMAFTPFVSDTLLEVCDVLLPIAPSPKLPAASSIWKAVCNLSTV